MPVSQGHHKELRQFGVIVGGVFLGVGLWPWVWDGTSPRLWALGLGAALSVFGAVCPSVLKPVHKGWMFIGHTLGWINTRIILGLFFYAMLTPMGVLARMLGKDFMHMRSDSDAETYRVSKLPRASTHFQRQF